MTQTRRRVLAQLSALAVTACTTEPGPAGGKGGGGGDTGGASGTDGTSGADGTDGTGLDGSDGTGGTDTGGGDPDWLAECDASVQPTPEDCRMPTAFQSEGPFLRGDVPVRSELNVTGDEGEPLVVSGRILDPDCMPVEGAEIIIWKAGGADRFYDTESADANLYGKQITLADGVFCFYTLKPTPYGPEGNTLPAHIHVAVLLDGVRYLTTQLYFEGDEYLDILDFPPPPELITRPEVRADGLLKLHFDFVLPRDPPPGS